VQFDLLLDYAAAWCPRRPLRLLDLCSGPGSLARRALERLPSVEVVAVDVDPWLLELGRRVVDDSTRLTWRWADLRDERWLQALPHSEFDAVVSTTATHWFEPEELSRIYRQITTILAPDGLLANADVIPDEANGSRTARLAREMLSRWQAARIRRADGKDWRGFWDDARREPAFARLLAERDKVLGFRRPRRALPLQAHIAALHRAGLRQTTEIWRFHAAAILIAAR
jgi:ubiquinone/menaquinone biosynthesis C-methylase UbiE